MKIHTSSVLLCIVFIIPYSHTTAHTLPKETIIDLDVAATVGPRILKPTHIMVTAKDLNGPSEKPRNKYILVLRNVRYLCTARDASLCPKIDGGAWTKTDNKHAWLANPKIVGDKLTLTKGGLEYTCNSFFPKLCPVVPGGVWGRDGPKNKASSSKVKDRYAGSSQPIVSCYSLDKQICRNMDSGNSWDIKKIRPIGYGVAGWMRIIKGAELFCKALDVGNCPFNDGKWVKVIPSTTKPLENHEEKNLINYDDINMEDDASTKIEKYRRQKKIYDADEKAAEDDASTIIEKYRRQKKIYDADEKAAEHKGDEEESYGGVSNLGSKNDSDSSTVSLFVSERNDSIAYDSDQQYTVHHENNVKSDGEVLGQRENEDQERSLLGDCEGGNCDDEDSPLHPPQQSSVGHKEGPSGNPFSTTIFTEGMRERTKEWSTQIGKVELICRTEHEHDCPKIRKRGTKSHLKWNQVAHSLDIIKTNMELLVEKTRTH